MRLAASGCSHEMLIVGRWALLLLFGSGAVSSVTRGSTLQPMENQKEGSQLDGLIGTLMWLVSKRAAEPQGRAGCRCLEHFEAASRSGKNKGIRKGSAVPNRRLEYQTGQYCTESSGKALRTLLWMLVCALFWTPRHAIIIDAGRCPWSHVEVMVTDIIRFYQVPQRGET